MKKIIASVIMIIVLVFVIGLVDHILIKKYDNKINSLDAVESVKQETESFFEYVSNIHKKVKSNVGPPEKVEYTYHEETYIYERIKEDEINNEDDSFINNMVSWVDKMNPTSPPKTITIKKYGNEYVYILKDQKEM